MKISPKTLRALKRVIGKNPSTYNIGGVAILDETIVATDVHIIAQIGPNIDTDKASVYLLGDIPSTKKADGFKGMLEIAPGDSLVLESAGGSRVETKKLEGQFPKVEEAFPTEASAVASITLNAELLKNLLDVVLSLGDDSDDLPCVELFIEDETRPVLLKSGKFRGAIMPVKKLNEKEQLKED